jgi:hypothetical protein
MSSSGSLCVCEGVMSSSATVMLVVKGLVGHLVHPDHIQVHGHWVKLPTKKKLQRLLGGV